MLIVALVLAVIGLAALVAAVVTSNEVIAWVCIGASALGVILLVVDAVRERQSRRVAAAPIPGADADEDTAFVADAELIDETDSAPTEFVPTESSLGDSGESDEVAAEIAVEDHPDEVVHDEPEYDMYSDDEPEYPESAEESAVHTVDETQAADDTQIIEQTEGR